MCVCTCGVSWVADVDGSGLTAPSGGLYGSVQLIQVYGPALVLSQPVGHCHYSGLFQQRGQCVWAGQWGQHTCLSTTLPSRQQLHSHLVIESQRSVDISSLTDVLRSESGCWTVKGKPAGLCHSQIILCGKMWWNSHWWSNTDTIKAL